jgi:hypothetical protein
MAFFFHLIPTDTAGIAAPDYDWLAEDLAGAAITGWPNRGTKGAPGNLALNRNAPQLLPVGGPGGRAAVRFPLAADHFVTSGNFSISGNDPRTYIFVTRSSNTSRHYFSHGVPTAVAANFSFGNSGRFELAMAGIDMYDSSFKPDFWQIIGLKFDPAGPAPGVKLKVDNNEVIYKPLNSLSTAETTFTLGVGNYIPADSLLEIARFQAFESALSDADMAAQMKALAIGYGLPF